MPSGTRRQSLLRNYLESHLVYPAPSQSREPRKQLSSPPHSSQHLVSWGPCARFYPLFFPPWTRHKAKAASGKTASSEDEELLGDQPRPREPSFLQALLAAFGPSFLISMCFPQLQDLLSFVNPQLLRSPTSLQPFPG